MTLETPHMIDSLVLLAQKDSADTISVSETVFTESIIGQKYVMLLMLPNGIGSIWISCSTNSIQKF